MSDLSFGKPIAKGANAVVYATRINSCTDSTPSKITEIDTVENHISKVRKTKVKTEDSDDIINFPFALKMMFNYDIQSNAMAILNAMYRETVPARLYYSNVGITEWEVR